MTQIYLAIYQKRPFLDILNRFIGLSILERSESEIITLKSK